MCVYIYIYVYVYVYSTPRLELFCKNTFLTAAEPMSPSLRPFYLERI